MDRCLDDTNRGLVNAPADPGRTKRPRPPRERRAGATVPHSGRYAASRAMAFHVPEVPAVVHTHPGAPPAAGALFQQVSPTAQVPVVGAAVPVMTFFPAAFLLA